MLRRGRRRQLRLGRTGRRGPLAYQRPRAAERAEVPQRDGLPSRSHKDLSWRAGFGLHSPNHSPSGSLAASAERSPDSRVAVAASAIARTAIHVNPPPTLIRRAPASAISATDKAGSASTLTGFDTAWHTALISSTVR